jgi:hypothetical protein
MKVLLAYLIPAAAWPLFAENQSIQACYPDAVAGAEKLVVTDTLQPLNLPGFTAIRIQDVAADGLRIIADYATHRGVAWGILLDSQAVLIAPPTTLPEGDIASIPLARIEAEGLVFPHPLNPSDYYLCRTLHQNPSCPQFTACSTDAVIVRLP